MTKMEYKKGALGGGLSDLRTSVGKIHIFYQSESKQKIKANNKVEIVYKMKQHLHIIGSEGWTHKFHTFID